MTGGEIKRALEKAGVVPSRRLGQNFLCDANIARAIVEGLELPENASVVEAGPGTGALSEHLPERVLRAVLIEYDERLAAALAERFRDEPRVEVHHADAARFDVRGLFRHRPIHLLGNLPYSSGGAILRNFLDRPSPCDGAVVMLQREVIDRLVARPRTKAYGVLSLAVQSEWEVEVLRQVSPDVFVPRPRVESTVVRLRRRKKPLPVYDAGLFGSLIRRGFSQRRKQLRKQMPDSLPWGEVSGRLGVPETVRAEELELEQWVELARIYDPNPLGQSAQRDDETFDVVDEDDAVIGQATRGEVHRKGLLHRAVHVFVFNRRGDLFLQQRSRLKDVHPGRWDSSASGHLDAGEEYAAAAVRELEEELGIRDGEVRELGRISARAETGWEHLRLYRVDHEGGSLRWPCGEIEAGSWFPVEEISAWLEARPQDFADGFLECWKTWGQGGKTRN